MDGADDETAMLGLGWMATAMGGAWKVVVGMKGIGEEGDGVGDGSSSECSDGVVGTVGTLCRILINALMSSRSCEVLGILKSVIWWCGRE